ncbi:MAG: hypothetical protein WBA42_23130 [Mesorhizobium sp.]
MAALDGAAPAGLLTVAEAEAIVAQIAERPIGVEHIAAFVENLDNAKFDEWVPDLLRKLWAERRHRQPVERASMFDAGTIEYGQLSR